MFKPFKPPSLKSSENRPSIGLTKPEREEDEDIQHRPHKKRRLRIHVVDDSPPTAKAHASLAAQASRKPLSTVQITNDANTSQIQPINNEALEGLEGYYMVLWRKFTMKKHKTWDGDGVLSVHGGYARLQDISGRDMGKCPFNDPLLPGSTLSIGGKDVEIDSNISKADFLAGRPFLKSSVVHTPISGKPSSPALPKKPIPLPARNAIPDLKKSMDFEEIPAQCFYSAPKKSNAIKSQFKNPLLSTTVMQPKKDGAPTPRHDPKAPGALVMKQPMFCSRGKEIVDVVLDPFLGQHLREHQKEGVKFLYECVMGMRDFNGQGALLADEMGLGKTLQTIALLWTLLKQNPIYGSDPVIKKALIVCPVSLIKNWKKEFQKWLGNERIGVFIADDKKIKLTDFTHGKSYSVMIIGYERLRAVQDELKKGSGIDIVIADEGHRLKTAANKSAQAIKSLNTNMRIILSGTPIQNDLSEFYTMVDFINPGMLGKYNMFKNEFEMPILKSRQPEASKKDIEKGMAREEELSSLTKQFILRRTAEILSKHLPPKTEYVLFCKPTQAQIQAYDHVLTSPFFGKVLGSSEASLQLITLLKKVCNAPSLLQKKDESVPSNTNVAELLKVIPQEILKMAPVKASSKFRVLDKLLRYLSTTTKEKIVIVSNYTATLDVLGQHLASLGLPCLRLDGSTASAKRQDLVDNFNRTPASKYFAFLLSAKSGGTGINLIGASRLVLFDVDWNPATDLQAMARIHRDGQKRPVKIYRFLMAGGMDEKIYQRQITKMGLADSVMDGKKNEASFTAAELRDLFRLDLSAGCQTHDLLGCDCKGLGCNQESLIDLPSIDDVNNVDDSDDTTDDLDRDLASIAVPATKANVDAIQDRILEAAKEKRLRKTKGKMQALMSYKHIDTAIFQGEMKDIFGHEDLKVKDVREALDDEVLLRVLKEDSCKVAFIFAK